MKQQKRPAWMEGIADGGEVWSKAFAEVFRPKPALSANPAGSKAAKRRKGGRAKR